MSYIAGTAGTNVGAGSITFTYLLPTVPTVNDVSANVAYNADATPIALNTEGAETVNVVTPPQHGTAAASGSDISYTPGPGFHGTDSFTYSATNEIGTSVSATVSITVAAPDLTVSHLGADHAVQGQPYETQFIVDGGTGPYSFDISGGLPDGLTLDAETGIIEGTPTTSGFAEVAVTATDSSTPTPLTATTTYEMQVYSNVINAPDTAMEGDTIEVRGENIMPGDYTIVLRSDPVTLGDVSVADDGILSFSGTIPADTIVGDHTIELVRADTVIGSATIEVTAAPVQPGSPADSTDAALPMTGTDAAPLAAIALLLLLGGAALLLARPRKAI
ncbi:putative Ig domain-containing protein [Paramicrobacterium fandaimingii]|uniref:putative Ig domain-containing protein n=1 Tax=Paramicrobacterium fandaimingii TaxID=2708079 RepID=UPI00141FEB49|nr:putative Ig domain-containing protein [Microbacterium fandaimingii]